MAPRNLIIQRHHCLELRSRIDYLIYRYILTCFDFPLIFDSGIRSGSDIVRALAFGADYAMIGRPVMYAMGADGKKGLRRIVEIIKEEASTTLGLVGLNDINDVTSNIVIDSTVNKVNY